MYTYKLILDNLNEKKFLLFMDDKVEHVSNLQPHNSWYFFFRSNATNTTFLKTYEWFFFFFLFSSELLITSLYYLQLPTRHLVSWTYFAKIVTIELLFPLTRKKKKKTMHFYIHNNLNVVCKMKNKRVSKKKKFVL